MPYLIDEIIQTKTEPIKGHWYVARPEQGYGLLKWKERIYSAVEVLRGRADAVYFKS